MGGSFRGDDSLNFAWQGAVVLSGAGIAVGLLV